MPHNPILCQGTKGDVSTCEELLGYPAWHHVEVPERAEDALQVAKHGR